ncbi:hypothetical protein [Rhabdochromatium marinum]|uniref:hypothetical protein n=1 Tax=Rhabdochromatium marinum TaxID=48729 RepID=UPI001902D698|nr:hypothetical protein [Rhabdochromatium marinum]MBK1648187.1 hypothetical protein [Rhabdochromatium marinum]
MVDDASKRRRVGRGLHRALLLLVCLAGILVTALLLNEQWQRREPIAAIPAVVRVEPAEYQQRQRQFVTTASLTALRFVKVAQVAWPTWPDQPNQRWWQAAETWLTQVAANGRLVQPAYRPSAGPDAVQSRSLPHQMPDQAPN